MKSQLILLGCCLALFSCGQGDKGKNNIPECAVTAVQTTDANTTSSYPATIKGKQDVEIRPKVAGFITKLYIDEGNAVHKGQPLFLIDPLQYKEAVNIADANVKAAKASVATQQLTVNNKRELLKKNIISEYDMQMAENQLASTQANLAQAKANLIKARQDLSYCTVTSPSNGVAGAIPFRVGSLVNSSSATPLTTVSDISQMYVYFSMTEKQLLDLTREGGSMKDMLAKMPAVELQLIDGSIYESKGKVETISGVIDSSTGSVSMRATFPNSRNILRSGGTAKVVFPYELKNIIMVPQAATVEIQDKKFVYVLQPNNTVKNTEIQISTLDDGQHYFVTSGLKPGDKIVTENVQNLKDGDKIKPITPAQKQSEYQKALKDQKEGNLSTAFK
jgi:RND family efflux transporter, MFP subunit